LKALIPAFITLLCATAYAEGNGQKAGLWEMTITRHVRDGVDVSGKMKAANEKMRARLESMPPEKRKQMEAMMGSGGLSMAGGGGARICISPAMAARKDSTVEPMSHCAPAKTTRSGNTSIVEFNCTHDGRTTVGTGKNTINGDTVTSSVDMTTTDATGAHKMQMESTMKYLGADCQGVKPMDEILEGAKAAAK
jgi:hypothetical protein